MSEESIHSYQKPFPEDLEIGEIVEVQSSKKTSNGNVVVFLVALMMAVGLFAYSSQKFTFTASNQSDMWVTKTMPYGEFNLYKYTMSISSGSASDVYDFVNTYITNLDKNNLGCSTTKMNVVMLGGIEIQMIDSSITTQSGRTVGEWSDYVSSLGTGEFNAFMHNKVQLYVNNLQPLYDKITADGVNALYRLSDSDGNLKAKDLAHISIPIPKTTTVFDIIGPTNSLTGATQDSFTEFSESECTYAHHVTHSLHHYEERYADFSESATDDQLSWMDSTGLQSPMVVQITVPVSSIENAQTTIDLVTSVTKASVHYREYSTCNIAIVNVTGAVEVFETPVIYVANNYYEGLTSLSIGDLEEDVKNSHATLLSDNGWDRYLDNHITYQFEASEDCASAYSAMSEMIAGNTEVFPYSVRKDLFDFDMSTHFFVGTNTAVGVTFTLEDCIPDTTTIPDICGCSENNNALNYYVDNVLTACKVDKTAA